MLYNNTHILLDWTNVLDLRPGITIEENFPSIFCKEKFYKVLTEVRYRMSKTILTNK